MPAETHALTAALQDGQRLAGVRPCSTPYTAVNIEDLLQKDPPNQQFTPGITSPSAAPVQVWLGSSTAREKGTHPMQQLLP